MTHMNGPDRKGVDSQEPDRLVAESFLFVCLFVVVICLFVFIGVLTTDKLRLMDAYA